MTRTDAQPHDERDLDPDAESDLVFLTMDDVVQRVALSRRTIETYIDSGQFPKPIKLTERRIVFIQSEVVAWMRQKIAECRGAA